MGESRRLYLGGIFGAMEGLELVGVHVGIALGSMHGNRGQVVRTEDIWS